MIDVGRYAPHIDQCSTALDAQSREWARAASGGDAGGFVVGVGAATQADQWPGAVPAVVGD